jgi:hypothetical protein
MTLNNRMTAFVQISGDKLPRLWKLAQMIWQHPEGVELSELYTLTTFPACLYTQQRQLILVVSTSI